MKSVSLKALWEGSILLCRLSQSVPAYSAMSSSSETLLEMYLTMDLQDLLQKATDEVQSNPYGIKCYRELSRFLFDTGIRPPVSYWKIRAHHEALSPEDITSWEDQIDFTCQSELEKTKERLNMYELISSQYPITIYKAKYLDHYKKLSELESHCASSLRELAFTLYKQNSGDFSHSELLFTRLIDSLGSDDTTIRQLYEDRICVPHKQLAETFQTLSSLISRLEPENYNPVMRKHSKTVKETERSQRYYEQIEHDIASDPSNPSLWARYMNSVLKYDKKSYLLVFYNSLHYSGSFKKNDESWLELWSSALRVLDHDNEVHEKITFLRLYLKMYPSREGPYSELIFTDVSHFYNLKQRIGEETVGSHQSLVKDILTVMVYLSKQKDEVHLSASEILSYCSVLPGLEGMNFMLSLFSFNPECSTAIATDYLEKNKQNAEIWSLAFKTLSFHQHHTAEALLHSWEDDSVQLDNPQLYLDTIQAYFSPHASSFDSLTSFHITLRKVREEIEKEQSLMAESTTSKRKIEPDAEIDSAQENTSDSLEPKKQKFEQQISEPARSREQFRIKVSPIKNSNEQDLRDFFKDCAVPLSVMICSENVAEKFAIVELGSERDVLICLSRHLKPLDGCPVTVERIFGSTVWMTNYPPHFSVNDIRKIVIDVSHYTPISIRVPSQQDNHERRFCYMDFSDPNSAASAANLLQNHDVEGFTLSAEISNPSLRKGQNTKKASFQIYLKNLNFKVSDKNSIAEFASQVGPVESVNVPLSSMNKEKGYKNNGYAFVTFTSEDTRTRALTLKNAEIDGRMVHISAVNTKAENQRQASHFENSSTVTIHGVSDHVSAEHLKKFVQEKVGPVMRVQLKPSKNMALVEFEMVKDSGRAELILQESQLESKTLSVGPKKDFFETEQVRSVPKMMPPSLMRRKRK